MTTVRFAVLTAVLAAATVAAGAAAPPLYDRIEAGREAQQRAEQERMGAIGQQIATIDRNAWLAGQVTLYPYPPVEGVYANGYGYVRPRAYRGMWVYPGYPSYPTAPGVFEPWPIVPGVIWGYPYPDRIRQPIGHEIVRTPNGSFYRPVYAMPQPSATVNPPAAAPAQPPVAESPRPSPPPVSPEAQVQPTAPPPSTPPSPAPSGPREF